MSYTLFAGCSYTSGEGFKEEKDAPDLWVNLLHSSMFFHTTKLNVSRGGRSNAGIFQDAVTALVKYPIEYAFIEWTSMPRYELELGFELYDTHQCFIPSGATRDHNLHNIKYPEKYLNLLRDRFTSLAHDCYEIINLIKYANAIANLGRITNTHVFFINGLCPWDKDFFARKIDVLPNQYTEYTQDILCSKTRDDCEVFKLYDKMHDKFLDAGNIDKLVWLNLYDSMLSTKIDVNNDNMHPGPKSNQQYFELFSSVLRDNI